ncbi:MAG: exodeoxyribonuclease VII large subunit [Syntrophomonadaceae bacterium]|jgi:exodeoxyribonuclease VII large subunit|nr:exodeoxyribonuclease VII large subunit [Syntrophomonadaceae bacterium]
MQVNYLSVGQINNYIGELLERDDITASCCIKGEISGYKYYRQSGHMYFNLQDENGSLNCVMFKSSNRSLRFKPQDGMEVLAYGRISVFTKQGRYQLNAWALELFGQGELLQHLEKLKALLAQQGYFDPDKKKSIPKLVNCVGIVTSREGAALRDMLRILKQRHPKVKVIIAHSAVQGIDAPSEIAAAVKMLNRQNEAEVILVGRGGGSLEDLMAFNHEEVVQAIYESKIPIISAVGHEVDFTLADFAADERAATPTQAAQMAVPDSVMLEEDILEYKKRMTRVMERMITGRRQWLDHLLTRGVWRDPLGITNIYQKKVLGTEEKMLRAMSEMIRSGRFSLMIQVNKLDYLSPLKTMRRGYALVEKGRDLVVSGEQVEIKDRLNIMLSDADLQVEVMEKEEVKRW